MPHPPLARAIQLALACSLAAHVAPAFAAPDDQPDQAAAGSRLAPAPGALPLVVIDRAAIDASGHLRLADVLRDLPQASFGNFRPQSGSSAQALASIDLAGLGSGRTLVLIDGRRLSPAPMAASSGADLNSIPLAMVERIEVLAAGASAIYGADAVAGVVNIVTRRDFEGAELSYGVGDPAVTGGDLTAMSAVFGAATDRTRISGGAAKSSRGIVFARDVAGGAARGLNLYGNNYYDWDLGALRPVPGFDCDQGAFYTLSTGLCAYDFNAVAADEAKVADTSVFVQAAHEINDRWRLDAAAGMTRVESFGRYAPTPGILVVADGTPNDVNGGIACGAGGCTPGSTDGLPTYYYHRFAAAGTRDGFTEGTRADYAVGLQGSLGDGIDLEFGLRRADYRYTDLGRGYVVADLASALANQGLYDLADPYGASPEVLSALQATTSRDARWQDDVAHATLRARLFELAGGESRAAFGLERTRSRYVDQYDSLSEAGAILGSAGNSAGGERDTTAVFAEWALPLAPSFDLALALRYDDIDRLDAETSSRASLRWQPLESLALRAHWSRGFRAPGLDITTQRPVPSTQQVNDPQTCAALGLPPSCQVGVPSLAIGNPLLASESSEEAGLGLAWQPLASLRASLDYRRLRIGDRITRYQAQDVVLASIDPATYGALPAGLGIERGADGAIRQVRIGYGNGGRDELEMLDLAVNYQAGLGRFGELEVDLAASHLLRYEVVGAGGSGFRFEGRFGYPATRARLATTWRLGDFQLAWQAHGIDGHSSGTPATTVGTWVGHDLQLAWQAPWQASLAIGVTNLGDRQPSARPFDGRPYSFYLYDGYGRTPYLRYTQRF